MATAVAIDTAGLALDAIPRVQEELDRVAGGRRRFQVHRASVHAMIPLPDSELWRHLYSHLRPVLRGGDLAKTEALDWQADPDDDLGDAAVLHHLHQQAATAPLLSSVISQSDHGNAATIVTGSALSASINATTQGRLLTSFDRHSFRLSCLAIGNPMIGNPSIGSMGRVGLGIDMSAFLPSIREGNLVNELRISNIFGFIVWAGPKTYDHLVFWQVQADVIDLFSRRTLPTSRPRRQTAVNQFLQVSDSPVVQETSQRNSLPHTRRFNGVHHRPGRKTWIAEMKPPKQKTKQDFGNFKSEVEAAHAVDAAFYHYNRPNLLNFPDTSLQFLSKRPQAPPGLDEKAKVKFVKEEAKLLLAVIVATSQLHSTHTNLLQIPESSRRCPSGHFRSLSEISWPFSCTGPDEVDDAVSQPQPWMLLDSICDISTTGVQTNLETLNSVQNAEWGWDWATYSSTQAAPPNVVNPSAYEIHSKWLDSLIQSPPAPTNSRSPSPSHFQDEISYALLEKQNLLG